MDGVFELHWQRREWGHVTCQLYRRESNGQLVLVDAYEQAPFEDRTDMAAWLLKRLWAPGEPLSV